MATKKTASKRTTKKATTKKPVGPMTKTQLIHALVDASDGLTRKDAKLLLESLATIGHVQLKRAGQFTVPGFAKFVVTRKPATRARKGINPFTGKPTVFKAKPASKAVKVRPVKAIKDAVS